jgi:phage terminase large subunit
MISTEVNTDVSYIPLAPFASLPELPPDINMIVCIGGRGGAKSYEVSKFIAFSACIRKKRCVVLRDEKELIRESIMNEIIMRFDTADENGELSLEYERLDTGIKDKKTNEMLVFSKGFRASDLQKRANLKSISNIDIAVIEEAEDIRDVDKFNTFADSIRKEGSLIIIILNTPDIQHWIVKRYFNLELVYDGYWKLTPKEIPGFLCIQTSYQDNPHLPEHIVNNYEGYGDVNSHLYNPHYYKTSILGLASSGRKGQIITKAKPIKLKEYLALPYKELFGLDFGTASPAGIVGVKMHRNTIWTRQLNYRPMNTLDIAKFFAMRKFDATDLIIADSADPKSISKLRHGYKGDELSEEEFMLHPSLATGFNVKAAKKGTDSIKFGLDLIDSMELFIVEESVDFWAEVMSYVFAQDKNRNYTNDPIDDFNHLIDPLRYVVTDAKSGGKMKSYAGG